MSRAQTLVLALLVLHVLLGALSLVIARGEHRSAALRWWGWGLLVYAGGLAITVASGVGLVPPAIGRFAGNSFITVAPVLCALGIMAHTLYRPNRVLVIAGVAATLAILAYGNFADWNQLLVNMIAPTPMAVLLFMLGAWAIAHHGPREAIVACRFLAGMSVLAVATWITRIFVMMALLDGTADRDRIDIVVSLFAIMQMVNGVGSTLALFWIDVRLMQAELSRVAHTDALTGLPNRRAILTRFDEEVSRASRHGQRFALAVFDLDRFKQVNDRHGHAVGDEVLKAASSAFVSAKRSEDVLARIGGEEFVVILSSQQALAGAEEAADRMRQAVSKIELRVGANSLNPTVSGGVALYPEDGQDWDALFATADRRLYAAKDAGRDRVLSHG